MKNCITIKLLCINIKIWYFNKIMIMPICITLSAVCCLNLDKKSKIMFCYLITKDNYLRRTCFYLCGIVNIKIVLI